MRNAENEKYAMTIGENVYNNLKSNIIELTIKPGEMISIKDLCAQLNVGRSPVRDAVIKLEKEGLITTLPQRGTMISRIDLGRVAEERYLRECLEEKTVKLFLECHTTSDIEKMKTVLEEQKRSIVDEDYRRFLQQDDEFHKVYFDATNKKLCWETIQSTSGHYRRIRLLSLADQAVLDNIIKQHEEMIICITEKKLQRLEEILCMHLTKLDTEELDLLKRYPDLFESQSPISEDAHTLLQKDFFKMLK